MTIEDVFAIVVCHDAGRPIVRVSGELDLTNAPTFTEALQALSNVGERDVSLDLSSVTFMDSTGIRSLLEGHRSGLHLRLVATSECVDRVLELAGLDPVLRPDVQRTRS